MIAYLEGALLVKGPSTAIVNVNGVGYEVWLSQRTLGALPAPGERVSFWVHTQVSEDNLQLIGFADLQDRAVFLELVQVSGIGPKLALNLLSQIDTPTLVTAIRSRDLRVLTALSGVGKKTAERILVELAEKASFGQLEASGPVSLPVAPADDALAAQLRVALEGLGYRRKEIEAVLAKLKPELGSLGGLEAAVLRALALIGG